MKSYLHLGELYCSRLFVWYRSNGFDVDATVVLRKLASMIEEYANQSQLHISKSNFFSDVLEILSILATSKPFLRGDIYAVSLLTDTHLDSSSLMRNMTVDLSQVFQCR
jgi:hypothetical protein